MKNGNQYRIGRALYQNWFPSFLRNYGTDFLQFLFCKTIVDKPILRTYSVREMQELIIELKDTEKYVWNVGKIKSGF